MFEPRAEPSRFRFHPTIEVKGLGFIAAVRGFRTRDARLAQVAEPVTLDLYFYQDATGLTPQMAQTGQFVATELAESVQISAIEPAATSLPAGLDVLLVAHPQNVPPALQYAIDQFLPVQSNSG